MLSFWGCRGLGVSLFVSVVIDQFLLHRKTTTIGQTIAALVRRGKSVLLSSFTHAAVDTMLFKLKELKVDFLRLGRTSQIHDSLQFATVEQRLGVGKSAERFSRLVEDVPVVATTCLGVNHTLLSHRRFDVCIIDEASQIHQLICLGPLRLAKSFILVGDHYQLSPLVTSHELAEMGAGESLFRRLCQAHPQAIVELQQQYRMNGDINKLVNMLIYSDRLCCGNAAVESKTLHLDTRLTQVTFPF